MSYQELFKEIAVELEKIEDIGEVASYIPELSKIDPHKF